MTTDRAAKRRDRRDRALALAAFHLAGRNARVAAARLRQQANALYESAREADWRRPFERAAARADTAAAERRLRAAKLIDDADACAREAVR